MTPEQFVTELEKKGITLDDSQQHQFEIYFKTLVEWNEKMNLTALTSQSDVYLKHFYDSISAAFYVDFTKVDTVCDVGAGAGFPSIPLKICFPHIHVTIVDSLKKRISFLNHLSSQLHIKDVAFYHDRAESFGRNREHRGNFSVITARAVARMSVLSELCLPLCKKGGQFIAMKGAQASEEVETANRAITLLGGELQAKHTFSLPMEQSERSIIIINKVKDTPKRFPRKPGTPNREPIE